MSEERENRAREAVLKGRNHRVREELSDLWKTSIVKDAQISLCYMQLAIEQLLEEFGEVENEPSCSGI